MCFVASNVGEDELVEVAQRAVQPARVEHVMVMSNHGKVTNFSGNYFQIKVGSTMRAIERARMRTVDHERVDVGADHVPRSQSAELLDRHGRFLSQNAKNIYTNWIICKNERDQLRLTEQNMEYSKRDAHGPSR